MATMTAHLMWDDVPTGTKSFVVTCYDRMRRPAPGWWHWVVANLPAMRLPGAGSVRRSCRKRPFRPTPIFGKAGYGGAAPPRAKPPLYLHRPRIRGRRKIEVDAEANGTLVALTSFPSLASACIRPVQLIFPGWRHIRVPGAICFRVALRLPTCTTPTPMLAQLLPGDCAGTGAALPGGG
ncbi:YbhB/YbcL family Raf kinase inhibitor-like protein [Klebsiella pneumoniae]|nr:YbhB/YbcL family Raf kinase inhibitor-like protein [Klebsiella pneumoniae]